MQKIKENIYAFIDSQNLNLSIRAQGWKLDFAKFRIYLRDKFNVEKAFLFIGYVAGNESLYTSLQEQGYIIWIIHTVCHFEGVFTTEKSKIPHFVRNDRLLFLSSEYE